MKKRVAYYVSRKNPLIWLAALVMLASAALRIANVCGKGADARTVWLLVVLPVTACVFYVLNILCNGKDRFYRSSVPVFLLAIYYGIKVTLVSPYLWLTFVFWIAYLAIAAFYAVTVSGHVKSTIPLLLLLLAAFAVLAAMHEKEFSRGNWDQLRTILPDLLFLLGGILTLLGMKMYLDSAYHPHLGRPVRRPQAPLARPDGGRRQLHYAHAGRLVQLHPRVGGDLGHGALYPRKAQAGLYEPRRDARIPGRLRPVRGEIPGAQPLPLRPAGLFARR